MKKTFFTLTAILLLGATLANSSFLCPVSAAAESYVALGDSISNGFGLEDREQDCCVFLVGRHFGYETKNYGVDGLTSDGLLEKIKTDAQMRESIKSASLITVEIGSNDLLGLFSELLGSGENIATAALKAIADSQTKEKIQKATEDVTEKLNSVFARVRELNPTAKLVVAEIYNPWYGIGIPSLPEYCDAHLGEINAAIHAQTENYNYTVAEVHRPFKEKKLVCGDFSRLDFDPHPTVRGHRIYADMLIAAAEKKLEGHFHTYGEWKNSDGERHEKECACGNVISENHAWGTGKVVKKATHTECGERLYECTVCCVQKTEETEKNGYHIYTTHENDDGGTHKRVCACGDTKNEPHVWEESSLLSTQEEKTYVCTKCNAARTERIQPAEPEEEPQSFSVLPVILGAALALVVGAGAFFAIKKKHKTEI